VFLSGNADRQFAFNMTNGDVWGKVAVDGSVFARSFGFGTRLTCSGDAANQATLIAYVFSTNNFVFRSKVSSPIIYTQFGLDR
jgi:hypothetical protein